MNAAKWVRTNIPPKWIQEIKATNGNGRPGLYLTKPGFYFAVCQGKSEQALRFRDWVFEDVLVKIEASGGYIMPTATSEQLEALRKEVDGKLTALQGQVNRVLASSGSAYMPAKLFAQRIYLRDPSLSTAKNERDHVYPDACRNRVVNQFLEEFLGRFLCNSDTQNVTFQWLCNQIEFKPQWIVPAFGRESRYSKDAQFPIWLMVFYLENVFAPDRKRCGKSTAFCAEFADANRIYPKDIKIPTWGQMVAQLEPEIQETLAR